VLTLEDIFGRLDIMYHRLSYISGGIFGRLDIRYHRLPYVSRSALPFKRLVLNEITINHSTNYILHHDIRAKT
jgi:hypothetical protein